jgi:TnpA family transposase
VLSGTPRDSLHMIDLIYSQDAGQRPDVIITDTGSYSDIVFALITLLGFDYRPQLADLPDAKLWRILIPCEVETNLVDLQVPARVLHEQGDLDAVVDV